MSVDFSSMKTTQQSTKGRWMTGKSSKFSSPSTAQSTTEGAGTGSSITKIKLVPMSLSYNLLDE